MCSHGSGRIDASPRPSSTALTRKRNDIRQRTPWSVRACLDAIEEDLRDRSPAEAHKSGREVHRLDLLWAARADQDDANAGDRLEHRRRLGRAGALPGAEARRDDVVDRERKRDQQRPDEREIEPKDDAFRK
eukprot:6963596-Prymnesium_polylepis.1